jgi:hypothetical protein
MKDFIVLKIATSKESTGGTLYPSYKVIAMDFDFELLPHLNRSVNILDGFFFIGASKERAIEKGKEVFTRKSCQEKLMSLPVKFSKKNIGGILYNVNIKVINEIMEKCGGNQAEAARILGMTRKALNYTLKRLGMVDWMPRLKKKEKKDGELRANVFKLDNEI